MYRRVFSSTAFSSSRGRAFGILAATSVGAVTLYSTKSRPIHNDSGTVSLKPSVQNRSGALQTLVWGSNKNGTLLLEAKATSVTTPTPVPWLVNVALRDLRTQASFSACVDARGDVYQWGRDVSEGGSPRLVLEGKDIVQLQLTRSKVFALSSSGVIYAISSDPSRQAVHEQSSGSWFGWLGSTPQSCDYVELSPNSTMSWREKVTSISAGDDHLLALTSLGRAFAHPVTKSANVYGQLGIRNIEVQNKGTSSPVSTELIPKSVSDPNSKTTAFIRPSEWSEPECFAGVDDTSIRFCTKLFEIPSLSGIQFAQLSAGARTSFARTKDGKVLGWGANQYGQIGLGGNIAVDAVTVPTEVILWRNVSKDVQTKCINVSAGGDLTSFTAERSSSTTRTADVLVCGNGQWGGLGNNQFSNFMSNPVRVRTVSGLTEYNESTKRMEAILPQAISVSPTGHVLLALGTPEGRDLFLWGRNHDSELGNGKKSSIPLPAVLNVGENERLMLYRRKADVYDLGQKVWKRNVTVEQRAVAGHNNSVIYWQVI